MGIFGLDSFSSESSPNSANQPLLTHNTVSHNMTDALANLPSGASLDAVLERVGIMSAAIAAAQFRKDISMNKPDSLALMVKNFYAMSKILVDLGLGGHDSDANAEATVVYDGGLRLVAEDVLNHFEWSGTSYKHKMAWFGWAEKAAKMNWDQPPGKFLYCQLIC
jgi:hypothetical protein